MKRVIDNFDLIRPLLDFSDDDTFYFVQIIQRKKDNNNVQGTNNTNRTIRTYRITSRDKLMVLKDEMVGLAKYFNARIGINLNKRSFEKTAFNTLRKMAGQMHNGDYRNVRKAYDSACGIHDSATDRIWLIDIDEYEGKSLERNKFEIIKAIQHSRPHDVRLMLGDIPSRNGCHLITRPFNVQDFHQDLCANSNRTLKHEIPDIHKNNPTNLYIP